MEEADKPIGAPKIDTSEETAQPNETKKRKLNWKGFFFGVFAVIVIEVLALTILHNEEPKITPPLSPTKAQPSPTSNPTTNLKSYINTKYNFFILIPPQMQNASTSALESFFQGENTIC